jgi:hypothetical protein
VTEIRQPRLRVVPCDLERANALVSRWHRHHGPVVGYRFALACTDERMAVRGVAITGRPVAPGITDRWTAEITRVATDGCPNACSALYAGSWRTAKAMGYLRLVTYILLTEPGTSLKAAGWRFVKPVKGRSWNRPSRPRIDDHPLDDKERWEVGAQPPFPPAPDFGTDGPSPQLVFDFAEVANA